jgi:hypothetical protein
MLDRVAIEALKDSIDIEQFMREHLDRVSGDANSGQLYARCPLHPDGRNSLSIRTMGSRKGQWTCHAGCGPESQRDLVNFIELLHNCPFGDALRYLEEYAKKEGRIRPAGVPGNSFPVETVEPFVADESKIEANMDRFLSTEDIDTQYWLSFLEQRKISFKTRFLLRLGVDKYGNLTVPARDVPSGKIKGLRFRAMDGSRWWAKSSKASQILYGYIARHNEKRSKTIYITEGETDALSLLSLDDNIESERSLNVIAMFGAKVAWREEWSLFLKDCGTNKIVLCGDNDRAGRAMNQEIFDGLTAQGFTPEQVYVMDWDKVGDTLSLIDIPEKYDINEAIKADITLEQFEQCNKPYPTVAAIVKQDYEKISMQADAPVTGTEELDLPNSAWPPLLADMRDALHVRIPTPDPMIMGSLLALTSHVVGRRACTTVFGRHVPAMYCMNVGDTNIGKSAILDYMSQELFPSLHNTLSAKTKISTYGFFGSAEGVGKAFTEVADNRVLQMADEYSTQLMKARSEGGGPVIQAILSLWQGSSQGSISKNGGWDLTGKHLAIASATTKIYLHTHMRREDVMGGYANRFTYWLGFRHQARKVYITQDPDPNVVHEFCDALRAMDDSIGSHGPTPSLLVQPTVDASKLAREWVENFEKELTEMDEMQNLVTNRIPSHIARIAILFALLDHNPQITKTTMRRAIEVGEYLQRSVWHVYKDFGESGQAAAAKWIMQKIQENEGKFNKRDLRQRVPSRYTTDYTKAISDLQRQGVLLEETQGKKKFWVLAQQDDL